MKTMGFFEKITQTSGFADGIDSWVAGQFSKIGLPEPCDNEIFYGSHGFLLPIQDAGVVVRIEHDNAQNEHIESPFIIPTLYTERTEGAILEICPGAFATNNLNDFYFVSRNLKRIGRYIWDRDNKRANTVIIPQSDSAMYPHGFPVLCDRPSTKPFEPDGDLKSAESSQRAEQHTAYFNALCGKLYGDIKDAFTNIENGSAQAWRICRKAKAEGRLVAGWRISVSGSSIKTPDSFRQASHKYAAHLHQHNPDLWG